MGLAANERNACCDALLAVGPDAPTLCEGWTARDLAVHLWVRENDPVSGLALIVPPLKGWAAERTEQVKRRWAFPELVDEVRTPGGPFRIPAFEEAANLVELFVHAEDVRRPNGMQPRPTTRAFEDRIAKGLPMLARGLVRKAPVGVVLERSDTGETLRVRKGSSTVTLVGLPSELVLFVFGRTSHAVVQEVGLPDDVAALRDAV